MNVKYKDFEFNGSIDELRFAFPFLTGNDCTKAVETSSETKTVKPVLKACIASRD